jgi:oligopeptidase B
MIFRAALVLLAVAAAATAPAQTELSTTLLSPRAAVIPVADTLHGDVRIDDYAWLEDRSDPEVIAYLEAENAYTEAMMEHTEALQESLFQEIVGRIKETDLEVPYRKGDYFYYSRTEEGKDYPIFCRKKGNLLAAEEVIFDQNALAEGHEFFDVGILRVSPDHHLLAYSVDTTGAEKYALYVKDLATGELLPDVIPEIDWSIEWANDNRTFFYTTTDDAMRPDRLRRHVLGTDPAQDAVIFHEPDERFRVYIEKTLSEAYLILSVESRVTSEEYVLDADDPLGSLELIEPRRTDVEYYVCHRGDALFILTNDDAENYKVMKAPVSAPSKENWQTVIAHRDSVKVERIEAFADHLVVQERERGLRRIRVIDLRSGWDHYVEFPDPTYAVFLRDNREFNTIILRYVYESLTTPESVYDYDMETAQRVLMKQDEVLGGYDPSLYRAERLFATAEDGTRVPISLVYRKELFEPGTNPLYLMGYGSYGASMDPWFSSARLSLLDRGFVYAIAHVRGGGEMGEAWKDGGRLLNKKNTFTDFIACAEHLVDNGYAAPGRVVAEGGSAGGLLIGAVLNMRPDLFAIAVADVPFVDVLNTMLDESIPLTVGEYDEWGDPHEKEYYDYIKSYSPYDNVTAQAYPDILITSSLNDQRVQYWGPAKWTAKLRALKTDDNLLLLRMIMEAGHGGVSGRYDRYREWAFEYAFVLDRVGMRE